jgi:membrane associated rhomboid family serine protease
MNMVSLFGLGSSLEGLFGSLHFLFLLLAYVLLCGALYLPLAFLELLVYSPAARRSESPATPWGRTASLWPELVWWTSPAPPSTRRPTAGRSR